MTFYLRQGVRDCRLNNVKIRYNVSKSVKLIERFLSQIQFYSH